LNNQILKKKWEKVLEKALKKKKTKEIKQKHALRFNNAERT